MKVFIKDMQVDMEVKTKGIEFGVYTSDGSQQLGDLLIRKSGLVWCRGRTTATNGARASWDAFIDWMESG